jgi:hypothetical protein
VRDRHDRARLLLVVKRNGLEVDLVVAAFRVLEHAPDFHLPRLPVCVIHRGDAFFRDRVPGGRKNTPDTGLVRLLLMNASNRRNRRHRRALRQHRQAAAGPGGIGVTWSILFIILFVVVVLVEFVGASVQSGSS